MISMTWAGSRIQRSGEPIPFAEVTAFPVDGGFWTGWASTDDQGRTVFGQRAIFYPHGLAGQAYWWSVAPFHGVVFGSMQRNIAREAEGLEREKQAGRWHPAGTPRR